MMMAEERYCPCGKQLARKPGERDHKFLARRSCDTSCGAKASAEKRRLNTLAKIGVCCFCGGPVEPDLRGRLSRACRSNACRRRLCGADDGDDALPWPRITGPFVGDFSGHNLDPKDGGPARLSRPDNQSMTGCAAARCAE